MADCARLFADLSHWLSEVTPILWLTCVGVCVCVLCLVCMCCILDFTGSACTAKAAEEPQKEEPAAAEEAHLRCSGQFGCGVWQSVRLSVERIQKPAMVCVCVRVYAEDIVDAMSAGMIPANNKAAKAASNK